MRRRLIRSISWTWVAAFLIAIILPIFLLYGYTELFNATMREYNTEHETISNFQGGALVNIQPDVYVRLVELEAETGVLRAEASLHSDNPIVFQRFSDLPDQQRFATIRITDDAWNTSYDAWIGQVQVFLDESRGVLSSEVVEFEWRPFSFVAEYPFDTMQVFTGFWIGVDGPLYPADLVEVERGFPGYRLEVSGSTASMDLSITRPGHEKLVVITATAAFVIAMVATLYISAMSKDADVGQTAFALVGLVLAAAGLREFLGLTSLPGRPAIDVLVFLPTIVLFSFLIAYQATKLLRHRLTAEPKGQE